MLRLPFVLPEFTRVAWVSEGARATWQPRLGAINAAWLDVERRSVAAGVRAAALQTIPATVLPAYVRDAGERGLLALPLAEVAQGAFYNAGPTPGTGAFRVAVTTADHAADFQDAWKRSDDDAIGRLLGFPTCCRAFFQEYWVRRRHVDPTWPAAENSTPSGPDQPASGFDFHDASWQANILGRWVGVRAVPHLPCSFRCAATVELANKLFYVGKKNGHGEAMNLIEDVLRWPVEWSALHGIALITTPVWRISTRTDASADKNVLRLRGDRYPAEGALGVNFPFRSDVAKPVSFVRPTDWTDNGFSDAAAMEAAHGLLTRAVITLPRPIWVLDLGCGNGSLARRIAGGPECQAIGVEVNEARAKRARARLNRVDHAAIEDLTWTTDDVDLTLLMPGRLLEMPPEKAAAVCAALRGRRVLAYAYGDWLGRGNLLRKVGLNYELLSEVRNDAARAALVVIK